MVSKAEKVMVLGLDGPIAHRLYAFAKEGKLPTLGKLIDSGVFAKNCLGLFPTITPPNWTTIATGARLGTHGITDLAGHIPGDPLDKTHQNFDAREVLAEPLWKAAERVDKHSIIINYPTTWHTELKEGYLVGGYGLHINDWRLGVPESRIDLNSLTLDILLSTEPYPFGSEVALRKAQSWEGIEHSPKALEGEVTLAIRKPLRRLAPITWHLLVDQTGGEGFDTVLVARAKRKADVFARLQVGEWTPNIYDSFQTEDGAREAVFRLKLLELSADGANLRIYCPGLCSLSGWAVPADLEKEIRSSDGLPLGRAPWEAWLLEWIDTRTLVEVSDFHNRWLADAASYLLHNKAWDIFFTHIHTPDIMYHTFSPDLEPSTATNLALKEELEAAEVALYQSVDRCLGQILTAADDKTIVVVASDHGSKPKMADFAVNEILEQAGLLAYLPAEGTSKLSPTGDEFSEEQMKDIKRPDQFGARPARGIDWRKTKAIGQRTVHIYVNTCGRDPEGIVEPGEEYEQVQDQIIKALHEYVDPKTGLKPIVLALKREDARIIDHFSDRSGDVIYAVDPRFYKEHGPHLPTAHYGIGDMGTLLIMAGPGIKAGEVIERTVRVTDIVPTICHLAELPIPKDCEGAIIYQALEDPDAMAKELQSLRRNVERLKRMVERPPMC